MSKKGHIFILSSGRPTRSLLPYYKKLKLKTPMICYNGSYTYNPSDLNFKKLELNFDKNELIRFYDFCKPFLLNIMIENDTNIWVDKIDNNLNNYFPFKGMELNIGDIKIAIPPLRTFIVKYQKDKFNEKKLMDEINKYKNLGVCLWSGAPYFELSPKNSSKGKALEYIAKYYGIEKNNIIAIGDAINDIKMFEISGTSVAMKNMRVDLKPYATMVSKKDNNHNGVYYTLKTLL